MHASLFFAATRFLHLLQMIHHVHEEFLHSMQRSVSSLSGVHCFNVNRYLIGRQQKSVMRQVCPEPAQRIWCWRGHAINCHTTS